MSDISAPIAYSADERELIKNKLKDPGFNFQNWRDDDLIELRRTVRAFYRRQQNGNCAFCKAPVSLQSAANCHIEHIVPKSRRLEFIFEPKNLCVICADCNEIKRAQETEATIPNTLGKGKGAKLYPRSSNAFLIVHPHFDQWDEHITKFGDLYGDLSEKGAFTIAVCVLNRKLRQFGWQAVITDEAAVRKAAESWLNATDKIVASRELSILKRLLVLI